MGAPTNIITHSVDIWAFPAALCWCNFWILSELRHSVSSRQLNVPSAVRGIAGNNRERLHSVRLLENTILPSHRIPQLGNIVTSVKCRTLNYRPGSCVGEWWPPWGGCTTSAWASGWWWRAGRSAAARPPSWPWRPTPPSLTASCALSPAYPPPSPVWRTWPRPSLAVRHFIFGFSTTL